MFSHDRADRPEASELLTGRANMELPRIKPEHAPYRGSGNQVYVGGTLYGLASVVDDPTGAVWTLLSSMDGSRSPAEISKRVLAQHPGESPSSVEAAIGTFAEAGYVEDAGAPEPSALSDRDRERYSRNRAYFRWADLTPRASSWAPQLRLREARVTVIGVGGVGGTAVLSLAASGVGHLHCVDHDTVELSNLNRQVIYREDDLGRPKVEAAVEHLQRLNSDIQVTGERTEITDAAKVRELAAGCDLLVLSADKPDDIDTWANRACIGTGTPWIYCGYDGPAISLGSYVPGTGPCHECFLAELADERRELGYFDEDWKRFLDGRGHAVAAPNAGIAGFLVGHAALALLTGASMLRLRPGRHYCVNLLALDEPQYREPAWRAGCPGCGGPGTPGRKEVRRDAEEDRHPQAGEDRHHQDHLQQGLLSQTQVGQPGPEPGVDGHAARPYAGCSAQASLVRGSPWQRLYLRPEPHGHGSFLPTRSLSPPESVRRSTPLSPSMEGAEYSSLVCLDRWPGAIPALARPAGTAARGSLP
jgi:molybdopterin-synthase adenylyltransferase